MKRERWGLSLSGLPSQLTAIGGFNSNPLKNCEIYNVATNKWSELGPRNSPRLASGSINLECMRVLCFCGLLEIDKPVNSIESNDLAKSGEWKALPLDN